MNSTPQEPILGTITPPPSNATKTAAQLQFGEYLTPLKRISTYESGEWEAFILEWAHSLDKYSEVFRLGGAGDQGLDIIGFFDDQKFQGDWEGYQCKHYSKSLTPTDAYVEIRKLLTGVAKGLWIAPLQYKFAAPKGCTTALSLKLSNAKTLKDGFLESLNSSKVVRKGVSDNEIEQVRTTADLMDFSIFGQVDILESIEDHKKTIYFLPRFGGALPERPEMQPPPSNPTSEEADYLTNLLAVYQEKYGSKIISVKLGMSDGRVSRHLQRQREAFYSAEALRAFARDCVPAGTYENFMEDVFEGVIETHDREHGSGYARLSAVLEQSTSVQIDSNALIHSTRPQDRKGVCHQLSNSHRLKWVHDE